MKLSNNARQKELDFMKWNLSEIEKKDMSGKMEYCNFCQYQDFSNLTCKACQELREQETLCAKAFNKKNSKK